MYLRNFFAVMGLLMTGVFCSNLTGEPNMTPKIALERLMEGNLRMSLESCYTQTDVKRVGVVLRIRSGYLRLF
jgi:hypothetical protein